MEENFPYSPEPVCNNKAVLFSQRRAHAAAVGIPNQNIFRRHLFSVAYEDDQKCQGDI